WRKMACDVSEWFGQLALDAPHPIADGQGACFRQRHSRGGWVRWLFGTPQDAPIATAKRLASCAFGGGSYSERRPQRSSGNSASAGALPAGHPSDGEPIEPGRVYVAPSDHHMLVEDEHIKVTRGPRENRHRPAIDPLFRTAARSYGRRVVGVILS